jgi:hypothetical protein
MESQEGVVMESKFLLGVNDISTLMKCVYPHVEMMPKKKLLLDGKVLKINHRHIVTAKNNLISQRFWIVGNEAKDILVFEVLHNRHAVGTEEEIMARVFDESGLYGNDGYGLVDKIFVLNQKVMQWKVTTNTSS